MHGDEPKGDEREGEDRGEGDEPDSDDSTPRRCEPYRRRRRECCGRVASAYSLVYSIVGTLRYSLVAHEEITHSRFTSGPRFNQGIHLGASPVYNNLSDHAHSIAVGYP